MKMRELLPAALMVLTVMLPSRTIAAVPSSGTISPATPAISYTGGPYTGANPTNQLGDPDCDLFPNTCDDYTLTVDVDASYLFTNPGAIVQIRVEWPGQSDFDLYLQDPNSGATLSSSGAQAGMPEIINFSPVAGTNQYRIRTLVFAAANETFTGTIRLLAVPPVDTGAVAYLASTDVFTCNKHLEGQSAVFDHGGDGEPAIAIDKDGNTWITGIAGVGGGIGLWKFAAADVCAQTPTYLDNPDAGVGGGDTDIVIAPERNLLGNYNIYTSSLSLANVTTSTSVDGGNTFVLTPISTPSTVNDRQWNTAYGVNTVYLSFNIGATQPGQVLEFYRSSAAGAAGTFVGPTLPRGAADPQITYGLGNMAVDQRPGGNELTLAAGPNGEGNVYQGYHQNDGNEVWMAVSRDFGTTWNQSKVYQGPNGTSVDHKFTWVAVDGGGNVYTCWSDDHNVYYSVSQDIKTRNTPTWSPPRRVNNGASTKTCVLPMIEAGSDGRIVFAWYGTSAPNNSTPGAQYHYFHARCNNATDLVPVIEQLQVSDHVVHTGIVCQDGLGCSCCRDLLECQELAVNPLDGASIVTYAGAGGIYVTRQVAGAGAVEGQTITDNSGPCPALTDDPPCVVTAPPSSACILPGTQIATDAGGDATNPLGDPVQHDIEAVYMAEPWLGGARELVVTMKAAGLGPAAGDLPINTLWTVLWNNPVAGDPFPNKFVQMNTCDPLASPSFSYGHVEGNLQTADGDATGSWSPDGTIEIHINPALVGDPEIDQILGSTMGEVRLLIGTLCSGSIQTMDDVAGLPYKLQGNSYCQPHTVTCPADFAASNGDHSLQFTINNPSTASRMFAVALTSQNNWLLGGTLVGPVGPVSPGSSITIPVTVRVPGDCSPDPNDLLEFQATAMDLPSETTAQCATALICEPGQLSVGDRHDGLSISMLGSNPFRGGTRFSYTIPQRTPVRIEVFSVTGQRVRTLVNEVKEAGTYSASLSLSERGARNLRAGIYLVRLSAGEASRAIRVVGLE